MKSQLFYLFLQTATAQSLLTWTAPSASDLRSPCPLLNSLANHDFLPHSGADISVPVLLDALDAALNIDSTARWFFQQQGEKALTASSTGNASTFHLTDLRTHNLIEHDGSLSRRDLAEGDNWSFDGEVFNETKTYWEDDLISVGQAAKALHSRQETQKETNAEYDMPLGQYANAIGQTAMYLGLFGDYDDGNARKDWVVYFFGEFNSPPPPFACGLHLSEAPVVLQEELTSLSQRTKGYPMSWAGPDAQMTTKLPL